MIELLLLPAMVVAALLMMFPRVWRRKLMGQGVAFDILGSGFIVSTYAATGAAGGLTIAVAAALLLTLTIRLLRCFDGYEIYEIDGERRLAVVIAALATQGVRWVRSLIAALWKGGVVEAPPPLNGRWVEQKDQWSWRVLYGD